MYYEIARKLIKLLYFKFWIIFRNINKVFEILVWFNKWCKVKISIKRRIVIFKIIFTAQDWEEIVINKIIFFNTKYWFPVLISEPTSFLYKLINRYFLIIYKSIKLSFIIRISNIEICHILYSQSICKILKNKINKIIIKMNRLNDFL